MGISWPCGLETGGFCRSRRLILGVVLAVMTGAGLWWYFQAWRSLPAEAVRKEEAKDDENVGLVKLSTSKWSAAGIQIKPAVYGSFQTVIWRTGKIGLNEDRVAHLSPMVEGIVSAVRVRLGQEVKAGEVLAVLNSKEVGQAKLELARNRLGLAACKAQHDWVLTTQQNTEELLKALAQNTPMAEIDKRFQGRAIGDWRQQLLSAYSRRERSKVQLDNIQTAAAEGAIPLGTARSIRSEFETAEASYQALREEIYFQNQHNLRISEQKLRDAQSQVLLTSAHLLMMGFGRQEIEAMDPLGEGAAVSSYAIRAPFAGIVLTRDATLGERLSPQAIAFTIGDLSKVWIQADVPEADLEMVGSWTGKKLMFRLPGQEVSCRADLFHVGDQVDKSTRTIPLLAVAANPSRALKPGMFIEVQLCREFAGPVVQVPASAIQRYANQTFVFVHKGQDEFVRVDVTVGKTSGGQVEIVKGLTAGQPVVTEGGFALKSEMLRSMLAED